MLEIYSTVHRHINLKLNSQNYTFETTHLKQLPLHTFVNHTIFKPVKFSQKLKFLRLGPYKILKHLSDVTYELMSQHGSTFQTHRNHILPYYPIEPVIFIYLKQYHSTPSLINNPDTDTYQDTFSQFSSPNTQSTPTETFTKDNTVSNDSTPVSNDSTPKYQNFSYSSSLNDSLDKTFVSTDSNFEMLPNPFFYSNSSNNSFPQILPRIAESPNTSLTSPNDSQPIPNYIRAPHSPYTLRSLSARNYNSLRPNISFPQ